MTEARLLSMVVSQQAEMRAVREENTVLRELLHRFWQEVSQCASSASTHTSGHPAAAALQFASGAGTHTSGHPADEATRR
jgi:hypothetical protein